MKNKLFIIIALLFLLCGCGNYRELNNMAIVTGIGIDKIKDNYELSVLIANSPKTQTSNKEGEAQTTVYSAKGKTIAKAAEHLAYKSPKTLYLGHINVVIISKNIGNEGFLNSADYLLRHYESRKRFFLMQTKDDKPKDILKIVSPLESFPSQNIATLLKSNKESQSIVDTVDYSTFINRILEKGFDPILPVITISGNKKKGETSKNIESTEPKAYLKLNEIAIYKKDKLKGFEKFKNSKSISIINNNVNELKTTFKYKNNDIGVTANKIKTKIKIKNENNIKINITGQSYITEINTKENIQNPKTIKNIEQSLNKTIKKEIKKTIKKMQEKYHCDVFGFGNKIYKNYPQKWKKLEKNWNKIYFPNLNIKINVNIIINSTGSLDKTIKEAN